MKEIIGTSVLIAGFGREGQSVLRHIEKRYPDLQVSLADENAEQLIGYPTYETLGGPEYLRKADQFDTIVRSPGISIRMPDLINARHITTATNIFFSECPGVVIGVTGTKGKSTTSSLIYHILETAHKDTRLVGNIGYPALNALEESNRKTVFVAELSSYQLDDLRYSPHIAVILPIMHEHLNYHGSFPTYVDAKSHIVNHQTKDDYVVFYGRNTHSRHVANKSSGTKLPYAEKDMSSPIAVWFEDEAIWVKTEGSNSHRLMGRSEMPLLGRANVDNVMAAVLTGLIIDIGEDDIREAIKSFKSLEHRLEPVGTYSDVIFYNDSLATIPEATIHALEALGDKVTTLIAGGYDRGVDMSLLGKVISDSSIINLILFPTTGLEIVKAVKVANPQRNIIITMVQTMDEAIQTAYNLTTKNTICLLSPASASFNLFKDYADRGNQFKKCISKYS